RVPDPRPQRLPRHRREELRGVWGAGDGVPALGRVRPYGGPRRGRLLRVLLLAPVPEGSVWTTARGRHPGLVRRFSGPGPGDADAPGGLSGDGDAGDGRGLFAQAGRAAQSRVAVRTSNGAPPSGGLGTVASAGPGSLRPQAHRWLKEAAHHLHRLRTQG